MSFFTYPAQQIYMNECAQLLGQANLSLQDISGKNGLSYKAYEKQVGQAELWFQYQQILLAVMYKISDLSYVLNLGAITRENSYALCLPYAKQSEGTLTKLNDWHVEHTKRLKINVEESRRKRQGVEGFFMGALGIINDDFNYKEMSHRTAAFIEHQVDGIAAVKSAEEADLFQEDVRLVAKEGKLYCLPSFTAHGSFTHIFKSLFPTTLQIMMVRKGLPSNTTNTI